MKKLKVYFGASISTDRSLLYVYRKVVDGIKELGHSVLSEQVVNPNFKPGGGMPSGSVFEEQVELIEKADVMVAEVTVPSWGTAFLLERALEHGKPVLALFYKEAENPLSIMVEGHPELYLEHYDENNVKTVLQHNLDHFSQMQNRKGKLIVIDGADGSGKATQTELLLNYLKDNRIRHNYITFPRYYTSFHGRHVKRFLKGEFGGNNEVNPYLSSLAFALDRLTARDEIVEWLKQGSIVVADRYVSASMAHQASKMSESKREDFINWLYEMEYKEHKLPKEDIVIYLYVPAEIARRLLEERAKTGEKRDAAEKDFKHQQKSVEMYQKLVKRNKHWIKVNCVNSNGKLYPRERIHEMILSELRKRKILQ